MGRTRTLERRKEREQQKKRQRQITLLVGAAILAVAAIVLLVLVNQPAEAPIPEGSATRYQGIFQGKDDNGFQVLGSNTAPVKVVEYASFDCPHCREFHESTFTDIVDRVRKGEIQFTYVPVFGTGGIANGEGAARAAICAGEQGAFWSYHDALFTWQGDYANTAFSQNRLGAGISALGLDKGAWDQCMNSSLPGQVLAAAEEQSNLQNIGGTPAILVNGTLVQNPTDADVNNAINQALAQAGVSTTASTEPTALPASEATPEATASS
jgi:protein-disulfide isomerase